MPWVPNLDVISKGIKSVKEKNVGWLALIETMHKSSVSDPIVQAIILLQK